MKTADRLSTSFDAEPQSHLTTSLRSRSTKITAAHVAKLAIVYVRQSSPQQVFNHRESRERQYALAEHAAALGWPVERVLVIDEDQGQSGKSAEHRSGFHRLLAEVTMGHVGLVLGLEMSRLARSNKDWHHLLELCAVFDTVLADEDGVYNPNDSNDRLLLGLKGTISEFELVTMRNRLERGRINKAQRGELYYCVPMGYVLLPNGKVEFEPDEQARTVVQLLFDKFEELETVRALFYWMVRNDILLPIRPRTGPNKGQIEWRRPSQSTLVQTLHNPIYAGAYAHRRRPLDVKRNVYSGKRSSRKWLPPEQWQVLIRDCLPAYISWEQYLKIQERLRQNQTRTDTLGVPRNGRALLCGLLVCGECGWRIQVSYRIPSHPHYRCQRHTVQGIERNCFGLSANVLDELVSRQVLRALEPAALNLSLKAEADIRRERDQLNRHRAQTLQRARYDVELAARRYQSVDPENRLVAATLERHWEEALRRERELHEDVNRSRIRAPMKLNEDEISQIKALSSNIPALWNSAATTNAERQSIIRCLVERVVVHVEQDSEHAQAVIHWVGGYESRHSFVRPVRTYQQLCESELLMNRLVELREAGNTAEQTAAILNAEGFLPINPTDKFNRGMVRDLLLKLGLRGERNHAAQLETCEWWVRDLARKLNMPWQTLREWAINGWVHGRQTKVEKLWIVWADDDELRRLEKLRSSNSHGTHGYPSELTTPKARTPQK